MTKVEDWLAVQEGLDTTGRDNIDVHLTTGKPILRFIRNLRDLASYVHLCDVTSPYVNAAFIMYGENASTMNRQRVARFNNSLVVPPDISHYVSLVNEIAWKVHKAQWFQKWFVHRRIRPEEFGGRIHFQFAGTPVANPYPPLENAEIIAALKDPAGLGHYFGTATHPTYLLPQVFPEGSPTHPAYGEGHAVLGGACVTILKAFFDDRAIMTDPSNKSFDPDLLPPALISSDTGQRVCSFNEVEAPTSRDRPTSSSPSLMVSASALPTVAYTS